MQTYISPLESSPWTELCHLSLSLSSLQSEWCGLLLLSLCEHTTFYMSYLAETTISWWNSNKTPCSLTTLSIKPWSAVGLISRHLWYILITMPCPTVHIHLTAPYRWAAYCNRAVPRSSYRQRYITEHGYINIWQSDV